MKERILFFTPWLHLGHKYGLLLVVLVRGTLLARGLQGDVVYLS
jgi:hypothetical protein